jgi:hypothetical protein
MGFDDPLALLGRRSAVQLRWRAKDNDGVELIGRSVMGGKREVVAIDNEPEGKEEKNKEEEESTDESHAVRVAEVCWGDGCRMLWTSESKRGRESGLERNLRPLTSN